MRVIYQPDNLENSNCNKTTSIVRVLEVSFQAKFIKNKEKSCKFRCSGHASIFVETQDCKILMDPILFDPHAEGIEDICPKREVTVENIPEFDVLIISHRHLDHFDIRSLAALPKNVDVLIPKDKLIKDCLTKLGYTNIYTLKDADEVKIGSTRLLVTRSENRVPEYGILFADPSGSVLESGRF